MQMRASARGSAWAIALATALLGLGTATAGAVPVKVSVAGASVEASAQLGDGVVVGDVPALLRALGARAEYAAGTLRGTTFTGQPVEGRVGGALLVVGGVEHALRLPLADNAGRLVGPLADIAAAVGCRASYAKAAGELRLAPRLTQVEAHAADEGAIIHLRTTGPTEGRLQPLTDPPRAYADLAGIVWAGGSESIQAGGTGGLERIRWSLFQEWPPIARVVVDLVPGAQVRMLPAQDGLLVVTVRPAAAPPAVAPPMSNADARSLEGVHVVLDPVGGGDEVGARGAGTTEKAVALDIALQAAVALMDRKALVTLTRDKDRTVPPVDRETLICTVAPDAVVRLACGAGKPDDQGVQARYTPGHALLGVALHRALVGAAGATDRGAVETTDIGLARLGAPAALCVVGYLTSPTEGALLASPEHRKKLAAGVVEGIAAALGR